MRWTRTLRLRVRSLFRASQVERELDEELKYHLQHLIDDYVAAGMSPPDARYKALREMGAIEQRKEECRDARGLALVDTLRQDVTYALRGVRRNPVYSVVLVVSLALGIGANTAVYSVLHALLFRSLPIRDAHQLLQFVTYHQGVEQHEGSFSFPLYTELQQAVAPYIELAALKPASPTRIAIDGGEPETALVEGVTATYFTALRVSARVGRVLDASDDEQSGSFVAVLSHATWQRRFAGDPRAIGTTIRINNRSYTVVGVTAEDFAGLEAHQRTDVWIPLKASVPPAWLTSAGSVVLRIVGRLEQPAESSRVESIAATLYSRHVAEHFRDDRVNRTRQLRLRQASAGLSSLGFQYRQPLLILMVAVAIILLLCCANVANLLSARQESRKQELAIRISLGAGRARVFQQLVTEALALGVLGAGAGLGLAFAGSHWLVSLLPEGTVPLMIDLTPDVHVLAFTTLVGIVAALGAAALPALRVSSTNAVEGLRHDVRTMSRLRFGKALVVLQVAGSLVLLVAAGLMVQTLRHLRSADIGFDRDHLVGFSPVFPDEVAPERRASAFRHLTERVEALPGVTAVSYSPEPIYASRGWAGTAARPGEIRPGADQQVALLRVGPHFFSTLRIHLLAGNILAAPDHQAGQRLVVINQAAARHYFGDSSAVGQRLEIKGDGTHVYTVIGVVQDVKHYGIRVRVTGDRVAYLPLSADSAAGTIFVRTETTPDGLVAAVRAEARRLGVTIERFRLIESDVERMLSRERMVGTLGVALAVLATALAIVGLYGLLAYSVGQRRRELGVRIALGAASSRVMVMVLKEALTLFGIAVVIGIPTALGFTRLLRGLVYDVPVTDTATLVLATAALGITACVAALLPARRAAAIDPASAVRLD
jgi:predicted permease